MSVLSQRCRSVSGVLHSTVLQLGSGLLFDGPLRKLGNGMFDRALTIFNRRWFRIIRPDGTGGDSGIEGAVGAGVPEPLIAYWHDRPPHNLGCTQLLPPGAKWTPLRGKSAVPRGFELVLTGRDMRNGEWCLMMSR